MSRAANAYSKHGPAIPPDDDDELFDSDGNARPENEHWFFRKINKK